MRPSRLLKQFFESQQAGGIVLLLCTVASLVLANSRWQPLYNRLWEHPVGGHAVTHWINDGLMAVFFLLIGLELEREIYKGELSNVKKALLPAIAALGGMLVPAGFHLLFNYGTSSQRGAGIPMATDIAFAIGILSLLGSRVPVSLKIFLTALAVIDDLGAILTIAVFYTNSIAWADLLLALGIFAVLLLLNKAGVKNLLPYLVGGVCMWHFMLHSGVHATITGVLLAFAVPFGDGSERSPSYILQAALHKPVAFVVLPLFALANTCLVIGAGWLQDLSHANGLGIMAGLVLGKPLGILLFSMIAVSAGICTLPRGLKWKHIAGAGFLGGIGFTMSIFISLLAFEDVAAINGSKIAVLAASSVAGVIGFLWLFAVCRPKKRQ